eukprot:11328782-Alexandrium_andersonii.AAC.1
MSASLVGSEMCIRDSDQSEAQEEKHTADGEATADSSCVFPEDGPVTVSYTHLTLPTICSV